jgi:hypothetical protein
MGLGQDITALSRRIFPFRAYRAAAVLARRLCPPWGSGQFRSRQGPGGMKIDAGRVVRVRAPEAELRKDQARERRCAATHGIVLTVTQRARSWEASDDTILLMQLNDPRRTLRLLQPANRSLHCCDTLHTPGSSIHAMTRMRNKNRRARAISHASRHDHSAFPGPQPRLAPARRSRVTYWH